MKINISEYLEITKNNIPVEYNEGLYLFKAFKEGYIEKEIYQVIHLLKSRLGDIDSQDIYGRTPLICATENKHRETICVLLFYYTDPSIVDNEGKKAIDYIKVGKR